MRIEDITEDRRRPAWRPGADMIAAALALMNGLMAGDFIAGLAFSITGCLAAEVLLTGFCMRAAMCVMGFRLMDADADARHEAMYRLEEGVRAFLRAAFLAAFLAGQMASRLFF